MVRAQRMEVGQLALGGVNGPIAPADGGFLGALLNLLIVMLPYAVIIIRKIRAVVILSGRC